MAFGDKFRFQVAHWKFALIFCATLFTVCNAVNLGRLAQWFRQGEGLDLFALVSYLVAALCVFTAFFLLFAHRWTLKPAATLLLIPSAAVTYFIAKYNVAIDSSMIRNAVHTDAVEVGQLLSVQMIPYVAGLVLLPALLLWRVDVTFRASGRYLLDSLFWVLGLMVFAIALLYANFNAIHRAGNVSNKYIVYSLVPINLISGSINAARKSLRPWLQGDEKNVTIDARVATPGDLVVVLAVGESSRRKNFSLYGYDRRDTNPMLGRVEGLHHLDAVARRGSTLNALPEILEKKGFKLPTVVARAGIPTACYVNYTLYDNCAGVGETKVGPCRHDKCYDEDVLPLLEANLAAHASGYRFIVLHLGGGSHGPVYADRHPPEFLRFQPTCNDADVANRCTLEQIWNSYDNTILYVDHVVGEILHALERRAAPYVLIYLSDHGESLMENGVLFHGMPPGMALPPEQAEIPLLVKASVPMSVVPRREYTQPDVFDTVLDLFTIQTAEFDKSGSFLERPAIRAN